MRAFAFDDYSIRRERDGTYKVRIVSTGEIIEAPAEIVRLLWREAKAESKRWERDSLTDEYGVRSSRLISLEQRKSNDQCEEAEWLAAPDDQIEALMTRLMEEDFQKLLTDRQRRVFRLVVDMAMSVKECAEFCGISEPAVIHAMKKIRKKAKKFFGRG